ncbi:MAG: hypothetical protein GY799_20595 [Desulfobulbaceae bacterium]|nr:hypothetical protein [Desulfobulbaceae bacterium]
MTRIEIDRIQIALHGVSSQVVEAATVDLEQELRRRLGGFPHNDMTAFDMGELALGAVESKVTLDAAALRGIIADRLVQAIGNRMSSSGTSPQTSTSQGGV